MSNVRARDDGLRRVGTLTRWVAAIALAGTGVFTALAAKALPTRTKPAADQSDFSDPSAQPASGAGDEGTTSEEPSQATPDTATPAPGASQTPSTVRPSDQTSGRSSARLTPPSRPLRPTRRAPSVVSGGS